MNDLSDVRDAPIVPLAPAEPLPPSVSDLSAEIPGRASVLAAGVATMAAMVGVLYLSAVPLPHDPTFRNVLYLMWSADADLAWLVKVKLGGLLLVTLAVTFFLVAWAAVWPSRSGAAAHAALRWAYRFAPCWPLFLLASTWLARAVANAVYALAPWAADDATPVIASLEGTLLEQLQAQATAPWIATASAAVYSWIWFVLLGAFGPWLALRSRTQAVSQVLASTFLTPVLAAPFFLLFPVSDPWATNPLYGYAGLGSTAVRYLYPHAALEPLSAIATADRWATASCLPSLHVALPLVFALVAFRHRLRLEAWLLAGLTLATSIAVIYLGRHWMVDVVAAVPFAFGVHWLICRMNPRLTLRWGPPVGAE